MLLNLLMYLWFIVYCLSLPFGAIQLYRGKYMTWRDLGFLIFGFGFSFVPFYWLIHQSV